MSFQPATFQPVPAPGTSGLTKAEVEALFKAWVTLREVEEKVKEFLEAIVTVKGLTILGAVTIEPGATFRFGGTGFIEMKLAESPFNNWNPLSSPWIKPAPLEEGIEVSGLKMNAAFGNIVYITNFSTSNRLTFLHESTKSSTTLRFANPAGVNFVLQPIESVALLYGGAANRWRIVTQVIGQWVKPESLGAKIENGAVPLETRVESTGRIFLRGSAKVKAAEALAVGETYLTLPAGFRPLQAVERGIVTSGNVAGVLKISAAGVATLSIELKAGESVALDGVNFNRT